MRLGLNVGYWGLGLTAEEQLELVHGGRGGGLRLGVDRRGLRLRRRDRARLARRRRPSASGSARRSSRCPARSPAMTAMTAATLDQLSNGRMLLGHRHVRAAGGRGLARPALRQAARAHARVRRDRAQGARARAARVRRRDLQAAAARRARQGAEADDRAGAGADPDLHRGDRAEEHAARGRDRRRLAADLLLPRARGRVARAARGGRRARRAARSTTVRHRADRAASRSTTTSTARATRCGRSSRSTSAGWARASKNFYNALVQRYGFEDAAQEIQDLYLDGKKDEAAAAMPAELIDTVTLVRAARPGARAARGVPRRGRRAR